MKKGICARFWATPLMVLAIAGFLGGCSGGGGGTVNPVATPSPSATPVITGVVARLAISPIGDLSPTVGVYWSAPTFTPVANVLSYQVYRNNTLVGVVAKNQTMFNDAHTINQGAITYFTISAIDNTKLINATVAAPSALVAGVPVIYRVTALYATPETAASATPEYAETEIGQSDAITPQ